MTSTQRLSTRGTQRPGLGRWPALGLRVAGAGLLAATGGIHLDLYLTGYRSIPTIGWLFLLQVITAFGLAAVVAVSGSWLAAASGALFAVATLGGYLLSVWFGLFGFKEVRTTAGIVAGVIEVAAFGALAIYTLAVSPRGGPGGLAGRVAGRLPAGRAAVTGVAGASVLALVLLVVGVAGAGGQAAGPAGSLRAAAIGGARVLTNSGGFTLYWFAPDTPTASKCTGSCAAYWPPVKGPATAAKGVPGRLGTIKRPGGSLQATYNAHPLYTYVGDTAPGQAHGNNLNLNGGLWHEVTVP